MKVEIDESMIPEGYEAVRFGIPVDGDYVIDWDQPEFATKLTGTLFDGPELILRKKRWMPKQGERYYFVDDEMFVAHCQSIDCISDTNRILRGNCFKTKGEANEALLKMQEVLDDLH